MFFTRLLIATSFLWTGLTFAAASSDPPPVNLKTGEVCGYDDTKKFECTDTDAGKTKYASLGSLNISCHGVKNGNAATRPCILPAASGAEVPIQDRCAVDWECCTDYCEIDVNTVNGTSAVSADLSGLGKCATAPSGWVKGKGTSARPYIPAVPTTGKWKEESCTKNDECASKKCEGNKCATLKMCLRCSNEGSAPGPGVPCCSGLAISKDTNKCVKIPAVVTDVSLFEHFFGTWEKYNDSNNTSIEAKALAKKDIIDNFTIQLVDQEKQQCEFKYGLLEGSANTATSEDIAKQLLLQQQTLENMLKTFQFLFNYKFEGKDKMIPRDAFGTLQSNKKVFEIWAAKQNEIFVNYSTLKAMQTAISDYMSVYEDATSTVNCTLAKQPAEATTKINNVKTKYDAAKTVYKTAVNNNQKDQVASYEKLFSDEKYKEVCVTTQVEGKTVSGRAGIQLEVIRMLKQAAEENAATMKILFETSVQVLDVIDNKFEMPGQYAVNKIGEVSGLTYGLTDLIYAHTDDSVRQGTQKVNQVITTELAEEGDVNAEEIEEYREDDPQHDSFYKPIGRGVGPTLCAAGGEGEESYEDFEEIEYEGEWGEEVDSDARPLSKFCRGTLNPTGADGESYRAGNDLIETFPVYVMSPKNETILAKCGTSGAGTDYSGTAAGIGTATVGGSIIGGSVAGPIGAGVGAGVGAVGSTAGAIMGGVSNQSDADACDSAPEIAIKNAKENLKKYLSTDTLTWDNGITLDAKAPYKIDPGSKAFLNEITKPENPVLGKLLYLQAQTGSAETDNRWSDDETLRDFHPRINIHMFVQIQNLIFLKLMHYYDIMNTGFIARTDCLKKVLCQIAKDTKVNDAECDNKDTKGDGSGGTGGGSYGGTDTSLTWEDVPFSGPGQAQDPGKGGSGDKAQYKDFKGSVQGGAGAGLSGFGSGVDRARISNQSRQRARLAYESNGRNMATMRKRHAEFKKHFGGTPIEERGQAGRANASFEKNFQALVKSSTDATAKALGGAGAGGPIAAPTSTEGQTAATENAPTDIVGVTAEEGSSGRGGPNEGIYGMGGRVNHNDTVKVQKNSHEMAKEVAKDPKKYENKPGASIFTILTNRYMKSLDRILPREEEEKKKDDKAHK